MINGFLLHECAYKHYPNGSMKVQKYCYENTKIICYFDEYENVEAKLVYEHSNLLQKIDFTIEYKFDEYGNWTKQIHYNDNGQPERIIWRSIQYYEQ